MQNELTDIGVLDELIPIAFALCITAIIVVTLWLVYRLKVARIEALRHALASRPDLDPEQLRKLVAAPSDRRSDLRRFCTSASISAAFVAFALFLPSGSRQVFFGLAAFPGMISLAYLFFFLSSARKTDD